MSLPIQPAAYLDCAEIWERADQLRVGCRTYVGPDYAKAEYLRMRMHQYRTILRDQSRRAYDRSHPLWNTSIYDRYKVMLKSDTDSMWWLYVEPHGNWDAVANLEPIPPEEIIALPPDADPASHPRMIPATDLLTLPSPEPDDEQNDLE